MDDDRFLELSDLISREVAGAMLRRAIRKARALSMRDEDHVLGAMVRHIAAPIYDDAPDVGRAMTDTAMKTARLAADKYQAAVKIADDAIAIILQIDDDRAKELRARIAALNGRVTPQA